MPFLDLVPKMYLQGLFEESSAQKQKIGTTRVLSDGREFIYGRAGGANIAIGLLCQGATPDVANHGNLAVTNANANAVNVTVTLGNLLIAANAYAEGYLHINSGTGQGYSYKIKSHPAAAANAALVVSLYDPIRLALATAKGTLTKQAASYVAPQAGPAAASLVGVTVVPMTTLYYGWLQRKGPCPVLVDATVIIGDVVVAGSVAGSVKAANNAYAANVVPGMLVPLVGRVIVVNANAHYGLIDLNL